MIRIVMLCLIFFSCVSSNRTTMQSVILKSDATTDSFEHVVKEILNAISTCLLYTSPSPRDRQKSRMPSSA